MPPTLKTFSSFFCTLFFITLLPVCASATTEAPPAIGELCDLTAIESAVSHYRKLAEQGVWPKIPDGPTLREGEQNERISFLRKRLVMGGDLIEKEPAGQQDIFDEELRKALQKFQVRHGLNPDGNVGKKTLRELNVSVDQRIRQLTANLERCKTTPALTEHRYLLVNIADFTVKVFEKGKLQLSMPAIVGRADWPTPTFKSRISSLILNPTWSVPQSIAVKDFLPKLKKDAKYLEKKSINILGDPKSNTAIDPTTIDWANVSEAQFHYRLRQDSGSGNALGRLRFTFPNPYDIYLHDTSSKGLFQRDDRTFSSGCIRVAKPLDLAAYLLQGTPLGSVEALNAAISRKKTRSVTIPSPIAIYIVYMTAWVDTEGVVQFRHNIYNRPPALL